MMQVIEHIELASSAASITFSDIPQDYTDLYVLYSVRSNRSEVFDRAGLRFNGSSGTYTDRTLRGSGSGAASTNNDISGYGFIGIISAANNTADTFASGSLLIPNYAGSAQKSWSVDCVQETNSTLSYQTIVAGLWSGTSAITSLELSPDVGTNFAQFSSASLYGIRKGSDGTTTVS